MKTYYLLLFIYLLFPVIGYWQMQQPDYRTGFREAPSESEAIAVWNSRAEGKLLLKWSLWAIAFAILGLFPLMGLPGILPLAFYELTGILRGVLEGDKLWPAAIIVSILWPLGIPLGLSLRQLGLWTQTGWVGAHGPWVGLFAWLVGIGFLLRRHR